MTNSRSPCLTIWPSLKWMESMKPETRARTSTVSTAVKRPVNSSHSLMTFCSGRATATEGGGGTELAAGLPSQPTSACAANNSRLKKIPRIIIGLAQRLEQQEIVIDVAKHNRPTWGDTGCANPLGAACHFSY